MKLRGCAALVALVVLIAKAVLGSVPQDEFLKAHNDERASVGEAGLVWNSTVASYAQSYGEKQRDQENCALVHSGGPYGENLFWTSASSTSASPTDAVNAWISEKPYYDDVSNTCSSGEVCRHYTQVVWETTLYLGCATIACNNSGGTFVICNYDPPGNIMGERPYSVLSSPPAPAPFAELSPYYQPSPSSPPEVPYDQPSQDEFLKAHNNARATVGVPGLVWNSTVASYAQSYGERQRDQAICRPLQSGGPYGENLYWASASSSASPTDAVNAWISEKPYYDNVSNTCTSGEVCSHYTQVVWKTSLYLGCAHIRQYSCDGGTFVICNYDPPGNIMGERPLTGQPSPAPSAEVDRPSPSSPAGIGKSAPSPSSKAGIAIAIASSFAACVGLGFVILLHSRARKRKLLNKQAREAEGELREVLPLLPTRFSYQDLHEATKGFSQLLGAGGCGSVYAGMLQDGRKVAVKTLEFRMKDQSKQFLAELATIGQTSHHNIVRLLGFCWEVSSRLLVYEYMEGGSLDHWLFHKPPTYASGDDEGVAPLLDWRTRYDVVLGIVRGLSYLHEECPQTILHFDIKPPNILLDGAFVAKLADFGMSRLMRRDVSKVVTGLRGTPGYIAPEWLLHGAVSKKCDIYSLGMVMLEVVGGRKNVDLELLNNFEAGLEGEQDDPWHFPSWAARKCEQGLEMELVDKRLKGAFNEADAQRLIHTAFWCIQEDPVMRPYVPTVLQWLEGSFPVKKPPFSSASHSSFSSKPSSSPRFSL